jgi:hypothetical protein
VSDDANSIVRQHAQLLSQQANFRRYWEEIAYYVIPAQATFLVQPTEGLKRTERLFDGSAVLACERFSAAVDGMLTPRAQIYHGLAPEDEDLADDKECKSWYDQATKVLFRLRYRTGANFASQTHENYMSLGAFGNMVLFVDDAVSHADLFDRVGPGPLYRALPMQECVWTTDHTGRVNTLYREFELEAQQALTQFGDKLPDDIRNGVEKHPYAKHKFIHCVKPNDDRVPRAGDFRGMEYASYYVAAAGNKMVDVGGYRAWPFGVGRYAMAPRENYGRGPAMACFPSIRTANEEKKTILRAGQKVVDPPVLLYEEGVLEAFNQRAGAANYGMLTADGQPLAMPFETKANIPLGIELLDREKGEINDAFLVSLFQFLSQRTDNMTAAEVYAREGQTAMLLAPTMGRQESEYLGAIVHRELQIASDSGLLPPLPDKLKRRGARYKVEYTGPLAKMARATQGSAILQTVQALGELAQVDPNAALAIDVVKAAVELADINGVPADITRSYDEIQQIIAQRQNDQDAENIAQHAPGLSLAALNLAKAQQAAAGAGATAGAPAPSMATPAAPAGA